MTGPRDWPRGEDADARSERALYERAIAELGRESQVDNVIEEAAELIFAICKHKREAARGQPCGPALDAVVEEIADLQIALDQAKVIYLGPSPEAERAFAGLKRRKLEKLAARLSVR